ncbi:alpha/beta fold hydrolase [Shewanella gaetbuli]
MLTTDLQYSIDNHPLHFADIGNGEAIIFLHGLFANSQIWQAQCQELSKHYRCITIDLWGHGNSTTFNENCQSLVDVADHIDQLVSSLKIDQYHLIGHGCGATIAAEIALKYPVKTKSLTLLNGFIGYEPQVNCAKYQLWLDEINQTQKINHQLATTISQLMVAKGSNHQHIIEGFAKQLSGYSDTQAVAISQFAHQAIYKRDTFELVEQLTLPTMVIVGVENQLRTVLESYLMSDEIDGACLHHISNAGHLTMIEQPEALNTLLSKFLGSVK